MRSQRTGAFSVCSVAPGCEEPAERNERVAYGGETCVCDEDGFHDPVTAIETSDEKQRKYTKLKESDCFTSGLFFRIIGSND